uniref:Jumonji domain containing 8 n=1 Tax=Amazona collaria TaxID=241587 RepID=A0A8B9G5A0_9PSIT
MPRPAGRRLVSAGGELGRGWCWYRYRYRAQWRVEPPVAGWWAQCRRSSGAPWSGQTPPSPTPSSCSGTGRPLNRGGVLRGGAGGEGGGQVPVRSPVRDPASLLCLPRFAFSRPVVLQGLTDNSVSAGTGTGGGPGTTWGHTHPRVPGAAAAASPHRRCAPPPQAFRALCTREKLLAAFGSSPVRLSTANTYSYRKVDVPFTDYVEQLLEPQDPGRLGSDTLYFFGDNNFTEWGPLFQQYVPPPFRIPGTSLAYSFGIAGSGSGVPFHWHGPGFSEVIFGRKRWFLYPPEKTPHFHPNETTLAWLHHTYPTLPPAERPLECTLRPGEVLYFPARWWHATLNLDTSVFISTFLG